MMFINTPCAGEPTPSFLDYLKKWLREMPVGVCREMVSVHEYRLAKLIEQQSQTAGVPLEHINDLKELGRAMRNCLDVIDGVIKEYGENVPLGDNPDYDDSIAAGMFLKAIGWAN